MVPSARRAALSTAGLRLSLDQENVTVSTGLVAIGAASSGRKGPATSIDKCRCHACETERNGLERPPMRLAYAVMCTCVRILSNALIVKRMPVALSLPVKRRTSRVG